MDRTYFNDCQHGSNAAADAAIDRCDLQRSSREGSSSATKPEPVRAISASKWSMPHLVIPPVVIGAGGHARRDLLRLKRLSTTAGYLATDAQERLGHFDAAGRFSVEAANAGDLEEVAT